MVNMTPILLFEVMDKAPSLPSLWIYFGMLGVVGFLLVRWHPIFLLLVIALWLLVAPLHYSEMNDPYVGPNMVREAGVNYVVQSYITMALGGVLPVLGIFAWLHRRKMSVD